MHTGNAESLKNAEDRSRAIAEQIAALLAEAETLAPGSVHVHAGTIRLAGAEISRRSTGWEVR